MLLLLLNTRLVCASVPWHHKWISWCGLHIDPFWIDVSCGSIWVADKPHSCYLASKKDRKQVTSLPEKTGLMWNSPCLWGLWKMPRGQDAWSFPKTLIKLQICCFYSLWQILKLATYKPCTALGSLYFLRFPSVTTSL